MVAATAKECLEQLQKDKDYILIVTKFDSEKKNKVEQWVYEDCKVALNIKWKENGMQHMKIGKSELVLSKLGGVYQILIDGVEHYEQGSKWNIIVYDKITESVTANLNFEE